VHDNIKELNILLEKFKSGDQQAFDEIYKRCHGHITFVCSKLCDNKEDVEEVVNDSFMAAFKMANELKGDTFLALLRKIAARRCYDKYKKNQIEYVYSDEAIETEALDENFLPEEYLQNKELQSQLLKIINDLPTKQREMIYLYYYAGINTEEIAKLNNCTATTVRVTLHTARNAIRNKMKPTQMRGQMQGISLAPILFAEAETFAAGYASASIAGAGGVASKSIISIVAGVVVVGVICATVYFIALQNDETYQIPEPAITVNYPVIVNDPPAIEESEALDEEEEKEEPEAQEEPEIFEPPPTPPQEYIPTETQPPILEEAPEEILPEEYPEEILEEDLEEELEEPEPIEEPPHIDITPKILEALALAVNSQDVDRIITYYGFTFTTQMTNSAGESFRFYVLDVGNGDILIGIATQSDNDQWRMVFEFFETGQRPTDMSDLLRWMTG